MSVKCLEKTSLHECLLNTQDARYFFCFIFLPRSNALANALFSINTDKVVMPTVSEKEENDLAKAGRGDAHRVRVVHWHQERKKYVVLINSF